jgi:hypothetical protein
MIVSALDQLRMETALGCKAAYAWVRGSSLVAEDVRRRLVEYPLRSSLQACMEAVEHRYGGADAKIRWIMLAVSLFRICGEQSFALSAGMTEAMLRTSLRGVEPEALRWPYRCLFVAIGDGCIWRDSQGVGITGFFVTQERDKLHIVSVTDRHDRSIGALGWDGFTGVPEEGFDERSFSANTFSMSEILAEDLFEELTRIGADKSEAVCQAMEVTPEDGVIHRLSAWCAARLAVHLACYLSDPSATQEPDPDTAAAARERAKLERKADNTRSPSKAAKIRRRAAKLPTRTVVWLGGRPTESTPSAGPGEKSTKRQHWVRGHWRKQPYRGGIIKMKWIRPHVRCKGNVGVRSRTYQLKESPCPTPPRPTTPTPSSAPPSSA